MVFRSWRRIGQDDMSSLIEYHKTHLTSPGPDDHFLAATLCVKGLIAHGWTYDSLVKVKSNLMKHLRLYIDLEQLSRGKIVRNLHLKRRRETIEDLDQLGLGEKSKRACRQRSLTRSDATFNVGRRRQDTYSACLPAVGTRPIEPCLLLHTLTHTDHRNDRA